MEEIIIMIEKAGIISVLVFVVLQLMKIVKYLSGELKEEIKKNEDFVIKNYESRIEDIKEEYNAIYESKLSTEKGSSDPNSEAAPKVRL